MGFQFNCECSSHSRMGPGHVAEPSTHTKHYEASVRICGAQRILGRAAIHGAVKLSWHSLQNQLLPLSLGAAIQQAAPHSRPGEEGLRKHLILSTPNVRMGWRRKTNKQTDRSGEKRDRKKEQRGVGGERVVQRKPVSLSQQIRSKAYMNNGSSNFSP